MVIKKANPPFEMRRVIVPSKIQAKQAGSVATQPLNLPLVPTSQERSIVEKIETATEVTARERTEIERALTMVIEAQADVIPTPEAAPISTAMLKQAPTITSQDILGNPTTAKTLLLLTSGPRFNKTATQAGFESTKFRLVTLKSYLLKNHLLQMCSQTLLKHKLTLFWPTNKPLWPISMHLREELIG